IAASAMLMPPDAEPVMPASTVTLIASLISTLGIDRSASDTAVKPGKSAITPPNPYSDAVLREANRAPATAALLPSANFAITGRQANANTVNIPSSNAPSTAQIAATLETWVTIGLAVPRVISCVVPYARGTANVSTKFATPTITRGRRAIHALGNFSASNASGSLRSSV